MYKQRLMLYKNIKGKREIEEKKGNNRKKS